jgi:outer membrane lipoprotein-sorting protein
MRISLSPCLLVTLSLLLLAQTSPPANPAPDKSLAAHLDALKDTRNLEARFICEKRLAALETPLVSRGRLWIRRADPHDGTGGAVRFSTDTPYVSELILAKDQVVARSQHETNWTRTNLPSRPGLTSVMAQLGNWSTGQVGRISEAYTVTAGTDSLPVPPAEADLPKQDAADLFVLTPTNKDLAKVLKQVTLATDHKSHHLQFIEILTQQDDATRYWFYDVKTNVDLPADVFTPTAGMVRDAASPASTKP